MVAHSDRRQGLLRARYDSERYNKAEVRNRLLGYLKGEVDEETARVAGELLAAADDPVDEDASVGPNDAYIAAMAEILDDAVLTDNVYDFQALGVPVETY